MPSAAEILSQLLQRKKAEEEGAVAEAAAKAERDASDREREQAEEQQGRLLADRRIAVLSEMGVMEELDGLKTALEEKGAKVFVGVDLGELRWTYGEISRGHNSALGQSPDLKQYYGIEIGVVFRGDDLEQWADYVRQNARKSGILGITGKVRKDSIFVVGENKEPSFIVIQEKGSRESLSSALAQACMNPQKFLKYIV